MDAQLMIASFTSKASSAGVVRVGFGFVPDFVILLSNIRGTNPNVYLWANNSEFSLWDVAQSLLITGSSGIITQDATGITAYDPEGARAINATTLLDEAQTANSDPKNVDLDGTAAAAGAYFKAGISIPADHQTASDGGDAGHNLVLAFRRER